MTNGGERSPEKNWPFWIFAGVAVFSVALLLLSARHRQTGPAGMQGDLLKTVQDDIAAADGAQGYYAKTYRYSETGYWPRIAGWMIEDSIQARSAEKKPFRRILDIGCGYGTLLAFVSTVTGAEGTCLDAINYVKPAVQDKYRLKFVLGDIERDPLPGLHPEAIIMTEVLEHFNFQPVPALKRIYDELAPAGRFYLSTPNAATWGRVNRYRSLAQLPAFNPRVPRVDGHIWVYSEEELTGVLASAGFRVERMAITTVEGRTHFNVTARKL